MRTNITFFKPISRLTTSETRHEGTRPTTTINVFVYEIYYVPSVRSIEVVGSVEKLFQFHEHHLITYD